MNRLDNPHRKILARVCARNDRKLAVVETNEPRWPFFIMSPQTPGADVPDYFSASFKNVEEQVRPMSGQGAVGVSIVTCFYDKRAALNYLR